MKNRKEVMKFLALVLSVMMLIGVLAGCQTTGSKSKKEFSIYAEGSDNVRMMFEKQIEAFNSSKEHNPEGYVAKLQFLVSGSGTQAMVDRLVAAHKSGQKNTDYDLVEFGGDNIQNYLTQGGNDMFIDLDMSKIPNSKDLQFEAAFAQEKFVPYRGTTVVLAYNSDVVKDPPKTDQELYQWIKDNPERFAYNPPGSGGAGSSFVATALYNFLPEEAGISTDEKWVAEWEQGWQLLEELHPFMYKSGGSVVYPNKNQGTIDVLASKEVDMIPAWADMIISQKRAGSIPESINISQISPAFTGSTVVLGIPQMGSNRDGAYAFMNYMLTPTAQNIALDNMAAIPVIDFSLLDPELTSIISTLKIDNFRINSTGPLGAKRNEIWDERIGPLK